MARRGRATYLERRGEPRTSGRLETPRRRDATRRALERGRWRRGAARRHCARPDRARPRGGDRHDPRHGERRSGRIRPRSGARRQCARLDRGTLPAVIRVGDGRWVGCLSGSRPVLQSIGKIEDIVRGLTVVLASGEVIELGGRAPREAVGPDLMQLFIGSEGTLGVITRALLVMHPTPKGERRAAYGFSTFEAGLDACRRIMQRDARPAVLRLYDETESTRNFGVDMCALVVLDEGDPLMVEATMSVVADECGEATTLDPAIVATWLEHRNDVSALAALWERGYVVDTIEVAGMWASLPAMHRSVIDALQQLPDITVASVHQSHAYLDGACLYFTFAARPEDVTGLYRRAWECVTNEVLARGGTLSHHHGVGHNRARFMSQALGGAFDVLRDLKGVLDPLDIMNPGVLGLGGDSW